MTMPYIRVNDIDILYVSRKEGGRGFASIDDSVDGLIRKPEECIIVAQIV